MRPHLLLLALLPSLALAEPTHQIEPQDYFSLDSASDLTVDRRGKRVIFVRSRWDADLDRTVKNLWSIETRRRVSTRLTFGTQSAWAPKFSSDDRWIYHLASDDGGHTQVFRIPAAGGTAQQITHATDGVDAYEVQGDDAVWYASTTSAPRQDPFASLRATHGDVEYADPDREHGTIRRVDLSTWRDHEVFAPEDYIMEFTVSPNGKLLAMLTAPDSELVTHEGGSEVVVHDLESGDTQELDDTLWRSDAPSPYGWLLGLAWSSDSRALAYRVDFDGYPGETFVTEFAGGEPNTWALPRPREVTALGSDIQWVPGQRELCLRGAEKGRVRIVCTSDIKAGKTGSHRSFPEGNVVVSRYQFSADGRDVVATVGTPDDFTEIYRLPARGKLPPLKLSDLNPHTQDWNLPDVQHVSWTSADGTEVFGVLETPAGWTAEDGPLPLLLQIHGGPTSHTPYSRRFRIYGQTSFAAKGWALLSPNYRGSVGYGDKFITDLIGHENDVDVADLVSGVDAMIASGVADPQRLAVMGWSNGGYLTNCLIAQTDRFQAASSGAGVFDQGIQWALEDTPGHVINFMEGLPWQRPEESVSASPMYAAGTMTTPTLIHFGEFDERVPVAHGRGLHRALTFYNGIESELITYPDAGHGLRTYTHRLTKMLWDHAWFEHFVTPTQTATQTEMPEVVSEDD
jgi:dipeptidyl aminopeptidase/acylaminoacyl peptidase